MGLLLACCSILLVSAAQLLMRWSLVTLPPASDVAFFSTLLAWPPGAWGLAVGLLAYALSMLCWLLALRKTALSKVYPLLSVSYVLVWCGALFLPDFHEAFHWGKLVGVLLILCGLLLIGWPSRAQPDK